MQRIISQDISGVTLRYVTFRQWKISNETL